MAYKLVCIYEFFDDISGKHIFRGEEIYDYTHIAKLVAANREHQFNKVWLTMSEGQWEWPPKLPEDPEVTAAKAAANAELLAKTEAEVE